LVLWVDGSVRFHLSMLYNLVLGSEGRTKR
jgi:hypothetical protein